MKACNRARTLLGSMHIAKHCLMHMLLYAAHAWAARLAALGAIRDFVRRLQKLAQPGGAAEAPAGAPAGALQGPAVDWLARLVPGAVGQCGMLAVGAPCRKAGGGVLGSSGV